MLQNETQWLPLVDFYFKLELFQLLLNLFKYSNVGKNESVIFFLVMV